MLITIFTAILLVTVEGYKILLFDAFSCKSHKIGIDPIVEQLLHHGHNVTEVVAYPFEGQEYFPGLTQYILNEAKEMSTKGLPNLFLHNYTGESILGGGFRKAREIPKSVLTDTTFQKFISDTRNHSFDVVIVCGLANEFLLPVAHRFGAPIILLISSTITPYHAWSLNIPNPPSYIPTILMTTTEPMTFLQRLVNFMKYLAIVTIRNYHSLPRSQSTLREFLPPDYPVPKILDVETNVSLLLVNTHIGIDEPRPIMPNVIEIGGVHCRNPKPLPKELDAFVNSSGEPGFIVMSLGSVIKSLDMTRNLVNIFISVFSKLPQKIVWKYEGHLPTRNMPPNILVSKWIPQQDLVGHPKCRLAILHGGLFSLQETAYHGVPFIGMPIVGDQIHNVIQATKRGFATLINWETLSEQQLASTIKSMTTESRFQEAAKRMSLLMRDQPLRPVDKATFWIEYIIRHRGAEHLKNPARHLSTIQYLSLDVILVVSVGLAAVFKLSYLVFKFTWKLLLMSIDIGKKKDKIK